MFFDSKGQAIARGDKAFGSAGDEIIIGQVEEVNDQNTLVVDPEGRELWVPNGLVTITKKAYFGPYTS